MALSYDRRAPEELMAALSPGGWAHSLVEYGRAGQFALDLQLRGYAGKAGHWATLYVGLTKVVDLHYRPKKGFRLDAHATYRQLTHGWHEQWEHSQPADGLAAQWGRVEDYLERVIPTIGVRFLREGAVQSAISGFAAQDRIVIDREAAIAFSSQTEKAATTKRLAGPLLAAVERSNGSAWWKAKPTSLGGECDALAVTHEGDVLAIEIKPARATGTIRWASLQVRHYADLFTEWATSWPERCEDARRKGRPPPPAPAEILQGMLDQRASLGLVQAFRKPLIKEPIRVRPVIAIGRGYSLAALQGLAEVQQRLVDAGLNDPPLEVASVTLAGRLDPIKLSELI